MLAGWDSRSTSLLLPSAGHPCAYCSLFHFKGVIDSLSLSLRPLEKLPEIGTNSTFLSADCSWHISFYFVGFPPHSTILRWNYLFSAEDQEEDHMSGVIYGRFVLR